MQQIMCQYSAIEGIQKAMPILRPRYIKIAVLANIVLALTVSSGSGRQQSYTILYSFNGGSDGDDPVASLVADKNGNFYGTTLFGGGGPCYNGSGCGTAFTVTPQGEATVLHAFCLQGGACTDGAYPEAGLIFGPRGKLYGTTAGQNTDVPGSPGSHCSKGCGNAYSTSPGGGETTLVSFGDKDKAAHPTAPLLLYNGRFYGTTSGGGAHGNGTVFVMTPRGKSALLYSFAGGTDGAVPSGQLAVDKNGDLFGATFSGGAGYGTVFRLAPDGTETVLHVFAAGADGEYPFGGVIADAAGDLYGTTEYGGDNGCYPNGCGVVFKVAADGTETVLHAFSGGGNDGANPYAPVIMDTKGNLYGTTAFGGASNEGTVFALAADGTESILHAFPGVSSDGIEPRGGLLADGGFLYGTTTKGGQQESGVVFKLTK